MNPEIVLLPFASAPAAVDATLAAASKAVTATKAAVSNAWSGLTLTQKAKTAAVVSVGGLVAAKSTRVQKTITNAPSEINTFTSNLASFIDTPSVQSGQKVFAASPFISTTAAAGIVGAVGYGAGGLISTALNTSAVRRNTATNADIANYLNKASSTMPQTNELIRSATNKYDVELAELNAKTSLKLAELQLQSNALAAKQTTTPAEPIAAVPTLATPIKKKTTKKKTKKKAKKKAKKKKAPKKLSQK